jgi:hypothetical protein
MPSNIATIEHTYELPHGTFQMYSAHDETEAVYYANGRAAYLFVPVVQNEH